VGVDPEHEEKFWAIS